MNVGLHRLQRKCRIRHSPMLQLTDPVLSYDSMSPPTQTLCAIFAARPSLRRLHLQAMLGPYARKGRRTDFGVLLVCSGGSKADCGSAATLFGEGHHYSQPRDGWG